MEKIKQNWIIILFSLLLFSGFFYWWEWRPTHIRQECSWVKKSFDFIPEVTQEQADKDNAECLKNNNTGYQSPWGRLNNAACSKKPSSAQPAKTWYEPEKNPDKYQFCLHSRGL